MAEAPTLVAPDVAERVLARLLAHGGELGELFCEERRSLALVRDDRRLERPQLGFERGACLRIVRDGATFYGCTDSVSERELLALAASLADAARAGARTPAPLAAPRQRRLHEVAVAPAAVSIAEKADLVARVDEAARAQGVAVVQVRAGYAESTRRVAIFNSDGVSACDERTRVRLTCQAVARRDGRTESGVETRGGCAGFELVADATDVGERAAQKALALLDAVDAPTGEMPVVVGNGFGGVLLHEAVGHGLEADAVQKGASVYAGLLGKRVAPPFVTAYDDGALAGAWGSDGCDDEGTATQRTTIIAEGELVGYLYDLVRAREANAAPTGNGRRESYRHPPLPRMTNTYFAPGDASPEDLIAGVRRGLYAVSFGGGQVEPATGDFVFGVSEGYLIENGRVTAPVRGATLVGNCLRALAAIDGIADDLEIATGFCGKGGQSVPAGVGQPHVRLRSITVGGTRA